MFLEAYRVSSLLHSRDQEAMETKNPAGELGGGGSIGGKGRCSDSEIPTLQGGDGGREGKDGGRGGEEGRHDSVVQFSFVLMPTG